MQSEIKSRHMALNVYYSPRSLSKEDRYFFRALERSLPIMEDFLWGDRRTNGLGMKKKHIQLVQIGLFICGHKKIRALNRDYRHKDKMTDVLSFPVHEDLRQSAITETVQHLHLGDIFICRDVALKQAKKFHISYSVEAMHLWIHGLLHLCGYDHERSLQEEKEMFQKEEAFLAQMQSKGIFKRQRIKA